MRAEYRSPVFKERASVKMQVMEVFTRPGYPGKAAAQVYPAGMHLTQRMPGEESEAKSAGLRLPEEVRAPILR